MADVMAESSLALAAATAREQAAMTAYIASLEAAVSRQSELSEARFSRLTNGGALECGVGFRQLRTCRRTRPGRQWANRRHRPFRRWMSCLSSSSV